MNRIFFTTILSVVVIVALGCKHKEGPMKLPPPISGTGKVTMEPGPHGMRTTINYTQKEVDSMLALPASSRPTDPLAVVATILADPPQIGLPPHLLPAKNVKIESRTDSTVLLSAIGGKVPNAMEIFLQKIKHGTDSAWVVTRLDEGAPTGPMPKH